MLNTKAAKSERFAAAHRVAKMIHVKGECYAVTFGQCLKAQYDIVKSVTNRKLGESIKINPAQILAFINVSGMTLKGWVNYGEGKASERFSTFRQTRMHQYLLSVLDQAESFELELEISFDAWAPSTYKICK